MIIDIFNDEMAMAEAIFKATYLEDEMKVGEVEVVTPANMLSLIGTAWAKKVNQEEGGKEHLIKLIAKVLWRGYHKHAAIAIELLKKEDTGNLLKIFEKRESFRSEMRRKE